MVTHPYFSIPEVSTFLPFAIQVERGGAAAGPLALSHHLAAHCVHLWRLRLEGEAGAGLIGGGHGRTTVWRRTRCGRGCERGNRRVLCAFKSGVSLSCGFGGHCRTAVSDAFPCLHNRLADCHSGARRLIPESAHPCPSLQAATPPNEIKVAGCQQRQRPAASFTAPQLQQRHRLG